MLVLLVFGLIGFASCDAVEDALEDAANPFKDSDYADKDENLLCLDAAIKWSTNKIGKYESDNAKEFDEATKDDLSDTEPGSKLFSDVWEQGQELLGKVGIDVPDLVVCSDAVSETKPDPTPSSPVATAPDDDPIKDAAKNVDPPETPDPIDGEQVGQECINQIAKQKAKGGDNQTVIILIDTTGSMGTSIDSVKAEVKDIVAEVTEGGGKVLIADYKDASVDSSGNRHCSWDDPAYRFMSEFTSDETTAQDWVNEHLSASGGCDLPESLYGGIYTMITLLGENEDFKNSDNRMLIAITDADPIDSDTTYDGRKDLAWTAVNADNEPTATKDDVTADDAEGIMADNAVQFVLITTTW